MRGKNRCYICYRKHDKHPKRNFGTDFPNKMRFCCYCLSWAEYMIRYSLKTAIKRICNNHVDYAYNTTKFKKLKKKLIARKCKKIYKIISLK